MADKKKKAGAAKPKEPHCEKGGVHEDAVHSFETLTRDDEVEPTEPEPMDEEWVAWRNGQLDSQKTDEDKEE